MTRLMSVLALGALLAVVGCKSDKNDTAADTGTGHGAQMMSNDACPHCPGVQKATADGKCPSCGMTVKKS